MLLLLCFVVQAKEIEQLKARLKQYGDYDEIKRELEIMKVPYSPFIPTFSTIQLTTSIIIVNHTTVRRIRRSRRRRGRRYRADERL
jgi:homeobox protein cut-like